jgi:hypothetical protein
MASAVFAETLDNSQYLTQLIPEAKFYRGDCFSMSSHVRCHWHIVKMTASLSLKAWHILPLGPPLPSVLIRTSHKNCPLLGLSENTVLYGLLCQLSPPLPVANSSYPFQLTADSISPSSCILIPTSQCALTILNFIPTDCL